MVFDFILYCVTMHTFYAWHYVAILLSLRVRVHEQCGLCGQCGPHVRHKSFVEFVQFVPFLDPWSHNGSSPDHRANQPQSHRRGRGGGATDSWYAIKQEWRISPQDATWGFYGPSCPGKNSLKFLSHFPLRPHRRPTKLKFAIILDWAVQLCASSQAQGDV